MKRNEHKPHDRTVIIRAETVQRYRSEIFHNVVPLTTTLSQRSDITGKGLSEYTAVPDSLYIRF